ncbi:uncharacterized protein C8orf76 homolog [Haliotis rubra]|uniref:uncharacterized protein C8orf76 homolog n=1 Tax=Haliotis rubra TaxID=36100 RepID=UPI001EE5669F|nr:uncharacterized protein C8orf76 homolog [Haliotis rubra]XP_046565811.1 uncharacterized protein C8orf76 homolog [Haliotis rubra]XP_046565812.1 uncharacterized protein C8orf76 homolog [Haliotis rubra]XP_046565813.1 uncharacterized protein C8orf76 homolog [Haliotis rubra]
MELGLALEDEDLGETRDRSNVPKLTSFNAKVCFPLWFETELDLTDDRVSDSNSQLLKFSGDHQYRHGNFASAAEMYAKSIKVLPGHAQATRLDLHQSLARCCLRLGRVQEAADTAQYLVDTAQNVDQKKQSYILQSEVAIATKDWQKAESCLHFLIGQQPHYTHFWLQLAQVYQQEVLRDDHQDTPVVNPTDQGTLNVGVCARMKLITCYLRTKLLLQSVHRSVSEVIRQRDQVLLQQMEEKLQELAVSEEIMARGSEFLGRDIRLENWDDNDVESNNLYKTFKLPAGGRDDFNIRWFAWSSVTSSSQNVNVKVNT